jgi:hypothetical protein
VARVFIAILAVGTLLLPVFLLFLLQPNRQVMMAIVAVFVVIFMVTISVVVELTAHDLFIGMAAYGS